MMDDFQRLQHAIVGYLSNVEGMEYCPVVFMRPRILLVDTLADDGLTTLVAGSAITAPAIQGQIDAILGGIQGKGGKTGLVAQVLMPRLSNWSHKSPDPQDIVRVVIRAVENVILNNTGSSCEKIAKLIRDSLHHWCPGARWKFYGEEAETITPVRGGGDSEVIHEVNMWTYDNTEAVSHVAKPVIVAASTVAPTTLTLTSSTSGCTIHYTLDGSFPRPGNSAASNTTDGSTLTLEGGGAILTEDGGVILIEGGSAVITIPTACTFLAVAYKDGLAPSNVLERIFT